MTKTAEKKPSGSWVQTERKAHEAWAKLIRKSPKAAELMHVLTARMGDGNAVIASQKVLSEIMGCHINTVKKSIKLLSEDRWIEVRQVGDRGTVNAHIINDRVAWTGKRDGIRYSLFTANVIVSDEEQPDRAALGNQKPLRRLPKIGEHQQPSGDGLPPPSQPSLPDMEPDLPTSNPDQIDLEDYLDGHIPD